MMDNGPVERPLVHWRELLRAQGSVASDLFSGTHAGDVQQKMGFRRGLIG